MAAQNWFTLHVALNPHIHVYFYPDFYTGVVIWINEKEPVKAVTKFYFKYKHYNLTTLIGWHNFITHITFVIIQMHKDQPDESQEAWSVLGGGKSNSNSQISYLNPSPCTLNSPCMYLSVFIKNPAVLQDQLHSCI